MDFHKRPEGQNSIQKERAHSIIKKKKAIAFILVLEETKQWKQGKLKGKDH